MEIYKTALEGVCILEPEIFTDERGYFFESFSQKKFETFVCKTSFVQDNESKSKHGVIRGLHFQKPPFDQAKLVRVIKGAVLDVAVDIRKNSPTFGKHISIELSEDNKRQLFIPKGFAHGFSVLSEEAIVSYKCDNYYSPAHEGGILWNDIDLDIDWKIDPDDVIVSKKDQQNITLKIFQSEITLYS